MIAVLYGEAKESMMTRRTVPYWYRTVPYCSHRNGTVRYIIIPDKQEKYRQVNRDKDKDKDIDRDGDKDIETDRKREAQTKGERECVCV